MSDELDRLQDSDPDALEDVWAEDFDTEPDLESEFEPDLEEALEDELEDDELLVDDELGVEEDDEADQEDEDLDEHEEALDELEAEELDMLTDDEESETLIVDEATELRAIRRAELAMEGELVGGRGEDEFVCQSCFLVLRTSQLANRRKMVCRDCAA